MEDEELRTLMLTGSLLGLVGLVGGAPGGEGDSPQEGVEGEGQSSGGPHSQLQVLTFTLYHLETFCRLGKRAWWWSR